MRRIAFLSVCAVMVCVAVGCSQAGNRDAAVKAIQSNDAQWNVDLAAKDPDKIASHYADDAVFIVAGSPPFSGKDAIRNAYKGMVADPAMSLTFQAARIDVAQSGELAYTEGSYMLTVTDPASKKIVHDHGSYVTTYRRQADGSWKAVEDIVSSEVPPPAAADSAGH